MYSYFCVGQDYDEDELEQELEALEQEELDKDLLGVGTSTNELPEVPSGDLKEPASTPKEKEKKKGNWLEMGNWNCLTQNSKRELGFLFHWFSSLFTVVAKPAEDDDDMKLLMSWAN